VLSGTHRNSRQEEVTYGRPAADALLDAVTSLGASRLLLVTTRSLSGPDGLAARLARALGERCVGVVGGVRAHSPREDVVSGAARARELGADLLVAVGGGSVIDATKVMQLCLWADVQSAEALDDFRGGQVTEGLTPTIRMVAIPTTLSAAEFTPFAGVTDPGRRAKEAFYHPLLAPRRVVLDPAVTFETPSELWASTGLKAVDHAVEQLSNRERAPHGDALAEAGLRRLSRALPECRRAPREADVRLECQLGMWLAMSGALAGRGMGASHAIGHTLGGMLGVPHGLTSAVVLPAVLRWNHEFMSKDRERLIAELLGNGGLPAWEAVRRLCLDLDLPTRLAEIGVRADQFRAIAEHTMHDRSIRTNPRPIMRSEDIEEILGLAA
jgi:maleylacetate reductase